MFSGRQLWFGELSPGEAHAFELQLYHRTRSGALPPVLSVSELWFLQHAPGKVVWIKSVSVCGTITAYGGLAQPWLNRRSL